MRVGISETGLAKEIRTNNEKTTVTKKVMNEFLEDVSAAKQMWSHGESAPWIEAPREIIERYNKDITAFNKVLFFTFDGVNVCETGTLQRAQAKLALSIEDRERGDK